MSDLPDHPVDDTVEDHIQTAHESVQLMRETLPGYFEVLNEVHTIFWAVKRSVETTENNSIANFLMRCHGSFLSAAGLGASGQLADAYAVSRAILEVAGYAYLAFSDEELLQTWLDGLRSKQARNRVRKEFSIGNVRRALEQYEPRVAAAFFEQYERTITFGGHPNVESVANSHMIEGEDEEGGGYIRYYYIFGVPSKVVPALETSIRCAMIAISIFHRIWDDHLEKTGLGVFIRHEVGRLNDQMTELRKNIPPDFYPAAPE